MSASTGTAWLRARLGRGLSPVWRTRCTGLSLGAGLGLVLLALIWGDEMQQAWVLHEALAQMQAKHQRVGAILAASDVVPSQGDAALTLPQGPGMQERDAAWLWLQQGLQAQGLKVEALRPEPLEAGATLASQLAHVRLSGAWTDWVAASQHMATHSPWWDWQQWQVQPLGAQGQVQVEARLRLWFRPDRAQSTSVQPWPAWPVVRTGASTPLFGGGDAPAAKSAMPAEASAPAASPAWQLLGVWTQAGERRVVLGHGAEWTVLAPGQALGPQAYRLDGVDAQGARLKGARAGQTLLLPWEGRP